jgi:methylthioribose-1-phosphate isomerase
MSEPMTDETQAPAETPPDVAAGEPVSASADPSDDLDVGRRLFFRLLAGDVVNAAVGVVGAASSLSATSMEAARSLLAEAEDDVPGPSGEARGFRTPFREEVGALILIDQRKLPGELVEVRCETTRDVTSAIKDMVVRGAPALGQVAAIAMAMAADRTRTMQPHARAAHLRGAANALANARPTAVNVRWAVDRMLARAEALGGLDADGDAMADGLRAEADAIVFEATDDHGRLAETGYALLPETPDRPLRLLTHCNTGPLACGQFGTALGVVQVAHNHERRLHVYVDETRPYLQGARLTAWELDQAGIPHTLIADVAAGWLLANGMVDAILVGADRIAANGDTANKIGTYPLAVLAARHGVPLFVIAPISTVDLATPDGRAVTIEQRPPSEVLLFRGQRVAPLRTGALNPAFDVTPAELISAIVTEEGALRPPYAASLAAAVAARASRRVPPAPFPGFVADEERNAVAESPAGDSGGDG